MIVGLGKSAAPLSWAREVSLALTIFAERLRIHGRWRLHGFRRRFAKHDHERERPLSFDHDLALWARLSDSQGARIYVYGTTEYFSMNLFKGPVEPGARAVDVGANLGEYTLIAAKYAGPTGAVLAFEPLPENFRLVEKRNHLEARVRV